MQDGTVVVRADPDRVFVAVVVGVGIVVAVGVGVGVEPANSQH